MIYLLMSSNSKKLEIKYSKW